MPSSMFTSMMLAPPRTWSSADVRRLGEVARLDQPREPQRAGHVRPLTDHLEVAVWTNDEGLEAGELRKAGIRGAVCGIR